MKSWEYAHSIPKKTHGNTNIDKSLSISTLNPNASTFTPSNGIWHNISNAGTTINLNDSSSCQSYVHIISRNQNSASTTYLEDVETISDLSCDEHIPLGNNDSQDIEYDSYTNLNDLRCKNINNII